MSAHPLDNPAFGALTGPHAHFAERRGRVLRYPWTYRRGWPSPTPRTPTTGLTLPPWSARVAKPHWPVSPGRPRTAGR